MSKKLKISTMTEAASFGRGLEADIYGNIIIRRGDQDYLIVRQATGERSFLMGSVATTIGDEEYRLDGIVCRRVELTDSDRKYELMDNVTLLMTRTNAAPKFSEIQTLRPNLNNEFVIFDNSSTTVDNMEDLFKELAAQLEKATYSFEVA